MLADHLLIIFDSPSRRLFLIDDCPDRSSAEAEFSFSSTVLPVWAATDFGLIPWPVESSDAGFSGASADD